MKRFMHMSTLLLLVLATPTSVHAQAIPTPEAIEREIIIQFSPGTLSLPPGRTQARLEEVSFQVPTLRSVLQLYNTDTIAKAFPAFKPADTLGVSRRGEAVKLSDLSEVYKITLASDQSVGDAVIRALEQLPGVLFAEPNGRAVSQVVYPNDPYFDNPSSSGSGGNQWNLLNTGQSGGTADADIDAPEAWDITKGSANTSNRGH